MAELIAGELALPARPRTRGTRPRRTRRFPICSTGRYPRFAAAMGEGGPPETWDPAVHFGRLLGLVLDGLLRAASE